MIIWDLDPAFLHIGPLELRWYGLGYALGFLLAYGILVQAAKRKELPGFSKEVAEEYLFSLIMASIIAARLFYVLVYNPVYYAHHILEIPAVWQGGLSIHGGLIGAIVATWFFCKKRGVNFYQVADLLVVPLAFAMIFVRLANYANGELWGTATNVRWCVQFPGVEGCRHPSQIYEALYSYFLFWILLALQESKRFVHGVRFYAFLVLYGFFRFVVTFYRELDPTDPGILGLGIGQWLSLAMMLYGLAWFVRVKSSGHPLVRRND